MLSRPASREISISSLAMVSRLDRKTSIEGAGHAAGLSGSSFSGEATDFVDWMDFMMRDCGV